MDHPENARTILSLRKRLGLGWALGGHPETSAHPDVEWTPFPAAIHIGPLRPIDGLFSKKMQLACATGPAGDGEELPHGYSGLSTLRYGRMPQVIRRGYGMHPQPARPRPRRQREKFQGFSSNDSAMELMIDSRKIHTVDAEQESNRFWTGHE